jgi:tRNA pseudouridine32 synthase / 23S rRNA pseudouridine746 synthase
MKASVFMHELSGECATMDEHLVVYADDGLLVLHKPAGLLCVPGRGADKQDCLSARVLRMHPDARVVHRLDMATSGLCLMARGARMQRELGEAFAAGRIGKRYVAVAAGHIAEPSDRWSMIELPIGADWPNRPRRKIDREHGKRSRTRWRVVACDAASGTSRVELQPLTGRTHQLRLHLQAIGHPILGDALYAPPAIRDAAPRLLLHANELRFEHPGTGEPMAFRSAPPF